MIDFHSHILPGMDDGANDVEESLALLSLLKEQGVTTVVATPHYRSDCPVGEFLHRRRKCYEKLKAAMEASAEEFPDVVLGAEVAINERLLEHKNLARLCIEGTEYILAEMPDRFWEPFLYHILYALSAQHRLKVIIAHVDRYFSTFRHNEKILKLIDMQPVFQVNAPALMYRKGKKLLRWLCRCGANFILGTDCHNMKNRKPVFEKPVKYIAQKYGEEFLEDLNSFSNNLLNSN